MKKALELAGEFTKPSDDDGKEIYVPYILDMIKDELLTENKSNTRYIKSDILQTEIDLDDYLVGKVCEREKIKLDNLDVDYQVEFLSTLALSFNGIIHNEHLDILRSQLHSISLNNEQIEKFKKHPLLIFNDTNKTLSFRFDFFIEYFKMIGVVIFLKRNDFDKGKFYILNAITQYVAYDNNFTKNIIKRIDNENTSKIIDSIEYFLKITLDSLPNEYCSSENKKCLTSSLFILSLSLYNCQTTEDRTSLLKLFFEDENCPNKINGLHLINLHSNNNKNISFNFNGLKFHNCGFINFEYFAHCFFDNETYFIETEFIAPLHCDDIKKYNIEKKHIDMATCNIKGIIDIVNKKQIFDDGKDTRLRDDLKTIIRFFWMGSSFRKKLKIMLIKGSKIILI